MKTIKIIAIAILAIWVIFNLACWIDIAKNCGENPTFAEWNLWVDLIKNA